MATQLDVRRIALSFPGAVEARDYFAFSVIDKGKAKGFAWVWLERLDPKKARVPNPSVIAVRVPNLGHKEALLASDSQKFFTEPHYNGFPAVLVRLEAVTRTDLELLLEDAWRCMVPKQAAKSGKTRTPKAKPAGRARKRRSR